jgi:hypothetical protein
MSETGITVKNNCNELRISFYETSVYCRQSAWHGSTFCTRLIAVSEEHGLSTTQLRRALCSRAILPQSCSHKYMYAALGKAGILLQ